MKIDHIKETFASVPKSDSKSAK